MHGGERRGARGAQSVVEAPSTPRPRTALHGLRVGLPAAAVLWAAAIALARRLVRRAS